MSEPFSGQFRDNKGQTWTFDLRPVEVSPDVPVQRQRRRIPEFTRQLLLTHQDHKCALCRGPLSLYESHVDHVVPFVDGGTEDFTNLQLTHPHCNMRKGRKRPASGHPTLW